MLDTAIDECVDQAAENILAGNAQAAAEWLQTATRVHEMKAYEKEIAAC